MNPELYQQGASFVQASQQQQQTTPQPIVRLANPTNYHLEATLLRKNQKQNSSDGAPPTPNNSFQSNNTLTTFSSNTIDPQILSMSQLQQYKQQQFMNPIKQESEINHVEMDFDQPTMSPLTSSSPGSPPNQSFETEDFGRSYKPPSHLDSLSPGNISLYSPVDNLDYSSYMEDLPMSAPTTTSAIGPMDVKTNMSNNTKQHFRHPHNNLSQLSMSMPVLNSTGAEWLGSSYDHPSSLQFPSTGADMQQLMTSGGFMDSEDADSQKQALLFEKRRRRRESHNAVERRRRDNINEKIQELSTLVPDLYIDSSNKPNKGVILRKSVDYIRQLKQMYEQEKNRNLTLETQVRELSSKSGLPIDNNSGSASSRSDLNNSSGGGLFG